MDGDTDLLHLLYVSSATVEFTEARLMDLLEVSRQNNAQYNITGLLLYKEGSFMQVIEGPRVHVLSLQKMIAHDARHTGMMVLLKNAISRRDFPIWSMGFHHIRGDYPEIPGFSDFLTDPFVAEAYLQNPSKAMRLLLTFRNSLR